MKAEKDYASQWMSHAEETAVEDDQPTAEVNIDGFEFLGRRFPFNRYIQGGLVPQALTAQMIRIDRGEQHDIDESIIPTEEVIATIRFQREAIQYIVAKPQIVTHGDVLKPGEVRWDDIFRKRPDMPQKLIQWLYAGQPGIPVKTEKGDVSVETLSRFPSEGQGSAGVDAGARVQDVGGAPIEEARHTQ